MGVDVYRKMQIKRSAGVVFLLGFIIICLGFYYDDLYNTFSAYPEFGKTWCIIKTFLLLLLLFVACLLKHIGNLKGENSI